MGAAACSLRAAARAVKLQLMPAAYHCRLQLTPGFGTCREPCTVFFTPLLLPTCIQPPLAWAAGGALSFRRYLSNPGLTLHPSGAHLSLPSRALIVSLAFLLSTSLSCLSTPTLPACAPQCACLMTVPLPPTQLSVRLALTHTIPAWRACTNNRLQLSQHMSTSAQHLVSCSHSTDAIHSLFMLIAGAYLL